MKTEVIVNLILSIVVAFTAVIAIWQTHKQIKLSNKQFLFDKRLNKYILVKNLVELYKENIEILDYSDAKEDEPITVLFQFVNLTNFDYLKDIACIINEPRNSEFKTRFLIKMEELKRTSTEIKLIFSNKSKIYLSEFVFNYQDVLMEMYKYQFFIDEMRNDKIPRKQKLSFKELSKEYGEASHRKKLYNALDRLKVSYKKINEKNVIDKIERSIKL